MQDEDVDGGAVAERLDGGRAGIAGGGADDGDAGAALRQHMLVQRPQQLHRHVLEGERGTVEQLHQPGAAVQLLQRRHRRMAEGAIGLAHDAGEGVVLDPPAEERPHDAGGDIGVFEPDQPAQLAGGQQRPLLRHIESAIAGETREQHIVEGKRRAAPRVLM